MSPNQLVSGIDYERLLTLGDYTLCRYPQTNPRTTIWFLENTKGIRFELDDTIPLAPELSGILERGPKHTFRDMISDTISDLQRISERFQG